MRACHLTIKLETGDVRALRVFRGKHAFRLAIYDEDSAVPLIDAKLNASEGESLRKALCTGK